MTSTAFVAHDIEKTGSFLIANPVNSVGFYVGDADGKEIVKRRFNLKVVWPTIVDGKVTDYGDFEPRCWNEFWAKLDPAIIAGCKADAVDQKEGWAAIGKFIDSLESGDFKDRKVKFLTDNASYDTATIDYNLERYTGRVPMRYTTGGRYRSVISSDDEFDMMPDAQIAAAKLRIAARVKHDHNPVNDAEHIYLLHIEAMAYRNKVV